MKREEFLTVEEAADFLRMSAASVRRHAEALGGFKLPGCRRWLFKRERLLAHAGTEQDGHAKGYGRR